MPEALAELTGVSKLYRKGKTTVEVLHELDLTIPAGDFAAVMGPSGSGKTTLLNLLGGLDRPTSGTVRVGDATLSSMSNSELSRWRATNVGFIFQFYNLLPVLTAQKNVELPLLLTKFGSKERARRAQIALDIVGLNERASHYPRELSGGQEQRVAIARAIVSDPALLLCDEPTGDLDRETADEILKLLQTLNTEHGKTIVMVTHDAQAAEYARRTLLCDKGTLQQRAAA
jgi:putative ABC transport system ATP-binding protein